MRALTTHLTPLLHGRLFEAAAGVPAVECGSLEGQERGEGDIDDDDDCWLRCAVYVGCVGVACESSLKVSRKSCKEAL